MKIATTDKGDRYWLVVLLALVCAAPLAAQQADTTQTLSDRQIRQRLSFAEARTLNQISEAQALLDHIRITYAAVHARIVRDSLRALAPTPVPPNTPAPPPPPVRTLTVSLDEQSWGADVIAVLQSGGNPVEGDTVRFRPSNGFTGPPLAPVYGDAVRVTNIDGRAGVGWRDYSPGDAMVVWAGADTARVIVPGAFPADALIMAAGPANVDSPTWSQLLWSGTVHLDEGDTVQMCAYNTDLSGNIIDKSAAVCPDPPSGPVPVNQGEE
jgi:hypothetical protein